MKSWELLEEECVNYLQNKYPKTEFIWLGKEDSTQSDILVKTNHNEFYIEVKSPLSQSGQFVLIPDYHNQVFRYSIKNKTPMLQQTTEIINYMNNAYANVTTEPKEMNLEQNILVNWVINYYATKKVKFIITKFNNQFLIIPLPKIGNYYAIKCFYRIKKSGSSSVSSFSKEELIAWWNYSNEGNFIIENKKLYFYCSQCLDQCKIRTPHHTYLLHRIIDGKYEVRKLSKTFNANAIFQIKLKELKQAIMDLTEFDKTIND